MRIHSSDKIFFLALLKEKNPNLWEALKNAEEMGMVYIDERKDEIIATDKLISTYPDLNELLTFIVTTINKKTLA